MGEHTDSDSNSFVPKPILRLHSTVAARCYDVSGVGAGSDLSEEENNVPEESLEMANEPAIQSGNTVLKVRELGLNYFRSKLVSHFDIAYKRGEVEWPKRNGIRMKNGNPVAAVKDDSETMQV